MLIQFNSSAYLYVFFLLDNNICCVKLNYLLFNCRLKSLEALPLLSMRSCGSRRQRHQWMVFTKKKKHSNKYFKRIVYLLQYLSSLCYLLTVCCLKQSEYYKFINNQTVVQDVFKRFKVCAKICETKFIS